MACTDGSADIQLSGDQVRDLYVRVKYITLYLRFAVAGYYNTLQRAVPSYLQC